VSVLTPFHEVPGVRVRTLRNVLDKSTREEWQADPGLPIIAYAPPWVLGVANLRIIVNGIQIDRAEAEEFVGKDGDQLVFYEAPHGLDPLSLMLIGIGISMAMSAISYAISAAAVSSISPLSESLDN
jgi:hypothetical protein